MPLKLLHHKSWHVWKRENIARVKRDEAKHEAEEREKKRKQQVVEGERRLKRLKAGEADGNHPPAAEHVNFFQEEEAMGGRAANKDFEAEAKAKKDKELRKMGIAPLGLGETATKAEFQPWYNMTPEASGKVVKGAFGKNVVGRKAEERRERDAARRLSDDPLLLMNKYVEQTKAVNYRETEGAEFTFTRTASDTRAGKSKESARHKKRSKKKRKHKKKEKKSKKKTR